MTDHRGRIAGVLSVEIISEFLGSPAAKTDEHRRRNAPMASPALLAAVGEVGEDFLKERSSDTLPCQADSSKLFCWDWATENLDRCWSPTLQQLELVLNSVVVGFAIAFGLSLLAHRHRWLRPPLLAGTGILYTIPSIALFFLLLPITGRGRDTAIIALSAYPLQIIYRNTMVGLDNVPAEVKDAARGIGQTDRQIPWRVELPLATPEIVAGLRIATVGTVAIATLAVYAGAGGLGSQIYGGGNLDFTTSIVIAGGIAIVMALACDLLVLALQRLATPWRRAAA